MKKIIVLFCVIFNLIKGEDFDYKSTFIDLSNKGLTSEDLEDYDFSKYAELKYLDLSSNDITSISPDLFRYNENLEKINLSNNTRLEIPEINSFLDVENLKELNLSNCEIKILPEKMFFNTPQLTVLDITDNPINLERISALTMMIRPISKIIISNIPIENLKRICNEIDITFEIKTTDKTIKCQEIRKTEGNGKDNEENATTEEDISILDASVTEFEYSKEENNEDENSSGEITSAELEQNTEKSTEQNNFNIVIKDDFTQIEGSGEENSKVKLLNLNEGTEISNEGTEISITISEESTSENGNEDLNTEKGYPKTEDESQMIGGEDPNTGIKDLYIGIADPKTGVDDPKTGVEEPETGIEDPKTEIENPKTGAEDPKIENEDQKTLNEDMKNENDDSKIGIEDPKVVKENIGIDQDSKSESNDLNNINLEKQDGEVPKTYNFPKEDEIENNMQRGAVTNEEESQIKEGAAKDSSPKTSNSSTIIVYVLVGVAVVIVAIFGYNYYKKRTYTTVNKDEDMGKEMQEIRVIVDKEDKGENRTVKPEGKPLMSNDPEIRDIDDDEEDKERSAMDVNSPSLNSAGVNPFNVNANPNVLNTFKINSNVLGVHSKVLNVSSGSSNENSNVNANFNASNVNNVNSNPTNMTPNVSNENSDLSNLSSSNLPNKKA